MNRRALQPPQSFFTEAAISLILVVSGAASVGVMWLMINLYSDFVRAIL